VPSPFRLSGAVGRYRVLVGLVLVATTVAFFAPLFLGKHFSTVPDTEASVPPWSALVPAQTLPAQADQALLSYPFQAQLETAVHHGTLPFWGAEFGGYPLYANGSSGELYPLHLIPALAGASPALAHDLVCFFEVLLAGWFMYMLLAGFGLSVSAALLGGISWMLAEYNTAFLHLDVVAPVMVLLPLDLHLVRRAVVRPGVPRQLAAGVALGVTLMSGQILYLAVVVLISAAYAICLTLARGRKDRKGGLSAWWRPLSGLSVIAVSAIGSSAVWLLPVLPVITGTYRTSLSWSQFQQVFPLTGEPYLAPVSSFLHLFTPQLGGITAASINDREVFIGTITAAFGLVGLFLRRPGGGLGRGLVLGIGLAAVGGPVGWVAYHLIPPLHIFRPWGRLLVFVCFGAIILGSLGFDHLLRLILQRWKEPPVVLGVPRGLALGVAVVLAATALQLGQVGRDDNPNFSTASAANEFGPTPMTQVLTRLQSQSAWPASIVGVSTPAAPYPALCCDVAAALGLRSYSGYDSVVSKRTVTQLRLLEGEGIKPRDPVELQVPFVALNPAVPSGPPAGIPGLRYDLLARLGVAFVVGGPTDSFLAAAYATNQRYLGSVVYAGGDGTIIRTREPSGPHVVGQAQVVTDDTASVRRFTASAFPWQRQAVIVDSQMKRMGPTQRARLTESPRQSPSASVRTVAAGINSRSFRVSSNSAGLLVIPENWDSGWSASVSGRSEPVVRVNYNQMAVPVPAGRSLVQLRYRPFGFVAGAVVSAVTVLVALGLGLGSWTSGRRRREDAEEGQGAGIGPLLD
jgi:hypothetical protein